MRQPHKNLFFAYRGGTSVEPASERILDKQLEDNATKALTYVLENADRSCVLEPFLQEIAGLQHPKRLSEIQFALQRVDISRPHVEHRVALSIAPMAELKSGRSGAQTAGRPDAWIWCDGLFSV